MCKPLTRSGSCVLAQGTLRRSSGVACLLFSVLPAGSGLSCAGDPLSGVRNCSTEGSLQSNVEPLSSCAFYDQHGGAYPHTSLLGEKGLIAQNLTTQTILHQE